MCRNVSVRALCAWFVFTLAFLYVSAAGAVVTIVKSPGVISGTSVIDGYYRSLGSDMTGMTITVRYETGDEVVGVWGVENAATDRGSASVDNFFDTTVAGDTWSNPWSFANSAESAISSIIFDAGLGDAFFDTTDPNPGTAGSASGNDFQDLSQNVGDVTATYRDQVGLFAGEGQIAQPLGDVFRVLQLDFSAGEFAGGETMVFLADTDNAIGLSADLEDSDVPAPAALLVFAAGLGLMRVVRRA